MRLGLEGAGMERTEVLVGRRGLWLGFGHRGTSVKIVSLKAIIGVHGFWAEGAAKGSRLVVRMLGLKETFLLCSL